MRRRRHLNEKRLKDVGLQVPNGQSVGLQVLNGREAQHEKGTSDESDDEMAAPEPKPTGATKAPEAPKLRLAVVRRIGAPEHAARDLDPADVLAQAGGCATRVSTFT